MADARPDGRRRRGADTRRALVRAAVDVVVAHGFDRLTLRQVADRAGASAAAATYHFGTVDALLEAVVVELERDAVARLSELTRRARSGELTLLDACTAYLADLLGPRRPVFLTMLELRVRVARGHGGATGPHGTEPDPEPDAALIDLIQDHVGNRERARELFAGVFGLSALAVFAPAPPTEHELRARMARLLAGAGLPTDDDRDETRHGPRPETRRRTRRPRPETQEDRFP
ncbi:hypothetical protein Ae406Ps2_0808c [Pseudonocardia sp. Ae406_Ps2]|uniref:TetR family transcriptional regulator n=1 Tax=unclassified Pseudonocardia TaxID=2619320 RepID=UPI00094B1630|nr:MULTISPECIES: TetR family transcriptional regulator [unclassified Pseudonocardia]OLM00808.1 hypothetical protein Ae406Ps2_0808c [Pseudonocardia sp. Ae406_Ps2]OLM07401.1 hypothetical protein Ae331Ps2_5111 [Pseudonocardia sp. Ae331_Ps2]OLM22386.1 hypothetical protein Ae706Ps2_0818c [Pseudonocardia sp. Ae706_Ps2]